MPHYLSLFDLKLRYKSPPSYSSRILAIKMDMNNGDDDH